VAQEPTQGTTVQPGETIGVTIGVGPNQVSVPNLEGMTVDQAQSALEDVGLRLGTTTTTDTDDESLHDTIASQSIDADSSVEEDTAVNVVVYGAPDEVTVPNLQGLTQEQAETELDRNDLVLGTIEREPHDSIEEGQVIRQDPAFGSTAAPGDRISVWISEGQEAITVPDVVTPGYTTETVGDAFDDIDGLSYNVGDPQQDCSVDPSTIIAQSVPAGQEVEPGTNVTVIPATDEGCPPPDDDDEDE